MKNHAPYLFILFLVALSGCQQPSNESTPAPADYCSSAGLSTAEEVSECTTTTSYSSPATITGTATFFKRNLIVSSVSSTITNLELGAPTTTALPIKYAEVRVLNSNGTVVQCGKTDVTGAIKAVDGTSSLEIPSTVGNYTVQVLARANHSVSIPGGKPAFTFRTAVKNGCTNSVHSISSTISSTGSGSYNTNLVAYARESESSEVSGGAFNIYNNMAVTYDYLAQNTGSSDLSCLNSKMHVYWTAGFNPAQFIDPFSDPSTLGTVSFYLRGYNELYINGGKLGNVASADTDHFDDAVIIHEFGHRLEDVCGKMDSIGGTHYGQFRTDARLAWSEGWGNFFGAHILRNNLSNINPDLATTLTGFDGWLWYLDTEGYTDGSITSGSELIRINLGRAGSSPEFLGSGLYYDKVDSTSFPGEGHFREVSISRSLFKSTNTCASGNCTSLSYFPKIWEAFEKDSTKSGMGKSIYPFRSSVRFYDRLRAVSVSGTLPAAISNMLNTDEAQQLAGSSSYVTSGTTTWVPYGIKLVSTGSTPCSLAIQPRNEDFTVTYYNPDQRYSNHFYYFDRNTLPSVTDIYMNVTRVSGTSTDIDLVLYADGYSFPTETCTNSNCTSYTKNTTSTQFIRADRSIASTPSTSYTKRIRTLNSLSSATNYLLNIRAYTTNVTISDSTQYSYTLTDQSGGFLCPSPTF